MPPGLSPLVLLALLRAAGLPVRPGVVALPRIRRAPLAMRADPEQVKGMQGWPEERVERLKEREAALGAELEDVRADLALAEAQAKALQKGDSAGRAALDSALDGLRELVVPLTIALVPLWGGFLVSQIVSGYAIPSRSMDETLKVGDVVLAEKVSSLARLPLVRGDVVLFTPPEELEQELSAIKRSLLLRVKAGVGSRDLFVKRVAAVAGDTVQLDSDGKSVLVNGEVRSVPLACPSEEEELRRGVESLEREGRITKAEGVALLDEVLTRGDLTDTAAETLTQAQRRIFSGGGEQKEVNPEQLGIKRIVPPGKVFVLGDCEQRSTDSRVWGPVDVNTVQARPFMRIWPPERVGPVDRAEPTDRNPFRREALRFREALEAAVQRPPEGYPRDGSARWPVPAVLEPPTTTPADPP